MKANKATLQFLAKTKSIKEQKWRHLSIYTKNPTLIDNMSLIFVICGQQSLAGNVGTKDSKNFSVLSSARYNLEQLTKLARSMHVPILVTDVIKKATEGSFLTRFIDTLELTPDKVLEPTRRMSKVVVAVSSLLQNLSITLVIIHVMCMNCCMM